MTAMLKFEDLKFYKNSLECVCLLVTDKEVGRQFYSSLLNDIAEKTEIEVANQIDLRIYVNKNPERIPTCDLKLLESVFRTVRVINLNISEKEDIYFTPPPAIDTTLPPSQATQNDLSPPPLGFKSGPNLMFFKCIDDCKVYNTILLLESDCLLNHNWLSRIKNFVDHANGFWISGATYDGLIFSNDGPMNTHINGGTGLYATGDSNFIKFIDYFYQYLIAKIKEIPDLAYDYALKMLIDEVLSSNDQMLIGKFINRYYLKNNLIFNLSLEWDKVDLEKFERIYNYAVLHTKHRAHI